MKKCKYCYNALSEQSPVCSMCKVDSTKDKKALTKEEKRIVYYCRALRITGFLSVIGGIFGIIVVASAISLLLKKEIPTWLTLLVVVNLLIAISFVIFGLSLRKFKKWCYVGGILIFSATIVIQILTKTYNGIIFELLLLSYVASPTSKKILYRQL